MRLPIVAAVAPVLAAVPLAAGMIANRESSPKPQSTAPIPVAPAAATVARDELVRAARDYRIAVYRTFRRDRAEFERRNAAWARLYAQWQRDGEPDGDVAMLVKWLRRATAASRQDAVGPLPPSPLGQQTPLPEPVPPVVAAPHDTPQSPLAPPDVPLARRDAALPPTVHRGDAGELPSAPLPIGPSLAPPQRSDAAAIEDANAVAAVPPRRVPLAEPVPPPTPADSDRGADGGTDGGVNGGVDVNEVVIRVAGHNLAVATLSEDIARADAPTIDALAGFVERLESLTVRSGDLAPYYALIDPADRARLRPLAPLAEVRIQLAARVAQAIGRSTIDSTVSPARRAEQLARLEELQRRVNRLASDP